MDEHPTISAVIDMQELEPMTPFRELLQSLAGKAPTVEEAPGEFYSHSGA